MLTKTLAELRTALLQRAGIESTGTSTDLTPAVLTEFVNDALYEGHHIITNKWADYFTTYTAVPVISGTDTYALPTNFYKFRRLWILVSGTQYRRLLPTTLDVLERSTGQSTGDRNYRYLVMGRNLILAPPPSANETLKLWYIPAQSELEADADEVTFDSPIEYKLILAIAWRDILDRQDLDPSSAIEKIDRYTKLLRTDADSRDADEPFYLDPSHPPGGDDDAWDGVW